MSSDSYELIRPMIPLIRRPNIVRKSRTNQLPKLTSSIYKYSIWHDIDYMQTTGDKLNAPRVRSGPTESDQKKFRKSNNCMNIHHTKKGTSKKTYQHKQTNWEETKNCNLSYQELAERYQKKTFDSVLRRLRNVIHLEVIDDELQDMSHLTFGKCKQLVASKNYIKSFKHLPQVPLLEHLSLEYNSISDFTGLKQFSSRCSQLRHLTLYGSPVTFTLNYRQNVFESIPNLLTLDGLARQEEDEVFFPEVQGELDDQNSCTIL